MAFPGQSKLRNEGYYIGIDERHRGHGYARGVLAALENLVRVRDATRIGLSVLGDNTVARHLYDRMGYRPTAILMRKDL